MTKNDVVTANEDKQDREEKLKLTCENLDKCSIAYIECYEEILQNRELLDKQFTEAHLNLSKARSLIGCNNLSIFQIPLELDANVFVNIEKQTDDDLKTIKYDKISVAALRESNDNNTNSDANKVLTPFPKWFGVLTPLTLKSSHKSFDRSIHTIIKLTELQSKLRSIENEYKKLIKEKSKLVNF